VVVRAPAAPDAGAFDDLAGKDAQSAASIYYAL
jgi:hypothetical protein